jgi:hydrogenase maturation factor HypF (carbamoyltransferase family)
MLCTGAEMKNTFCLVRGNQAVLSQHFGDLGDEGVEAQWRSALSVMQDIYAFQPTRVVCDAHPGYHATSGRRRRRCRLKPYCTITPTRRRAWRRTAGRSTAETLSP